MAHFVVGPDFGAFPVWGGRPGFSSYDAERAAGHDLAKRLNAWNLEWEQTNLDGVDLAEDWDGRGRAMVAELQQALGPDATVIYFLDKPQPDRTQLRNVLISLGLDPKDADDALDQSAHGS